MDIFKIIKCKKTGHLWNGCKCVRCGEIRDEKHRFDIRGKDGHGCSICRQKTEPHVWDGCTCKVCGAVEHVYDEEGFCIHCGQGKVVHRYPGKYTQLRRRYCSRCGKETPHLAVICDNPRDPNYGREYRSDCIPCGSAQFCPTCNSYVSATVTRNEFDGAESAVCDRCGTLLWHG